MFWGEIDEVRTTPLSHTEKRLKGSVHSPPISSYSLLWKKTTRCLTTDPPNFSFRFWQVVALKKCLQINRVREKSGRHAGTNDPVFRVMLQITINGLAKEFIAVVSSEKLGGGGSVSLTIFLIAIHSQDHLHCQREVSETLCSFG